MKKRTPTQKRSIEKKNIIIDKGFNLICKQGYYNTTTNDIAKEAGVSVGIIYQYFNDKKDILIEGVKNYINNIQNQTITILNNENLNKKNINKTIENIIDKFIETHTISKEAHEELSAMSHIDKNISKIYKDSELEMTEKITQILKSNNIEIENNKEKVHIIIGIIENLCHEFIYHKHKNIDYKIMKKEVIKTISSMIKEVNNER